MIDDEKLLQVWFEEVREISRGLMTVKDFRDRYGHKAHDNSSFFSYLFKILFYFISGNGYVPKSNSLVAACNLWTWGFDSPLVYAQTARARCLTNTRCIGFYLLFFTRADFASNGPAFIPAPLIRFYEQNDPLKLGLFV